MHTAKVFKNGRSQAVRLPKEYQFTVEEVYVSKIGESVILFPKAQGWELLSNSIGQFTDDFMENREQSEIHQNRKPI